MQRLDALVRQYPILLNGEFFLRPTSVDGVNFTKLEDVLDNEGVIAWSRIAGDKEILCALNRNESEYAILFATVDNDTHAVNSSMKCLFASDLSPSELNIETRNGKAIRLIIPPYALVIYM